MNGQRRHRSRTRETVPGVAIELLPASQTIPERNGSWIREARPINIATRARDVATHCGEALHISTLEQSRTYEYEIPNQTWAKTGTPSPPREVSALSSAAPYPSENAEPPLPEAVPDWRVAVNLERTEDPGMRNRIMNILDKHANMWDDSLGETKEKCHALSLHPDAEPHHKMPRRTGPGIRTRVFEEIPRMLHAGVIEHATSEWSWPVVLVSKKDGTLRFCTLIVGAHI